MGSREVANSPTGNTRLYNIGGELMVDDKNGNYCEQVKADVTWQHRNDEVRTATEQFLQNGTAYGRKQQTSSSHSFSLNADNDLSMKRLGVKSATHTLTILVQVQIAKSARGSSRRRPLIMAA